MTPFCAARRRVECCPQVSRSRRTCPEAGAVNPIPRNSMPNVRIRLPRMTPPALAFRPIPPRRLGGRSAVLALPLVALVLAGCMPEPVTPQGREVQNLYNIVFVIAAAIFLFVEGLIVYAVLRYRRKPTDTALPVQTHGNNLLEVIWTVIPTVIVMILFVLSWQTLNSIEKVSAADGRPDPRGRAAVPVELRVPLARRPAGAVHAAPARDVGAGRHDRPPRAPQPRRHPRLLRPALPVQARRRARAGERVRVLGRRGRRGPELRRPVRRAVRRVPRRDGVHRPCDDPGRLLRLAAAADRQARTRRRRPPRAARRRADRREGRPRAANRPRAVRRAR